MTLAIELTDVQARALAEAAKQLQVSEAELAAAAAVHSVAAPPLRPALGTFPSLLQLFVAAGTAAVAADSTSAASTASGRGAGAPSAPRRALSAPASRGSTQQGNVNAGNQGPLSCDVASSRT